MIKPKDIIKAFVVSIILAFTLSIGSVILFGSAVSVDPSLDWEKVNSMSYSEATSYIENHTKQMSGWEIAKLNIEYMAFVTPAFFALIGSLFVGLIIYLLWVRSGYTT